MLTKEMLREAREQLDVLEKGLDGAEVEWSYSDLRGGWREAKASIDCTLDLFRYRYRLKPKPPLVFEVGKSYRRRDGKKAVVLSIEESLICYAYLDNYQWYVFPVYRNGCQYRFGSTKVTDEDLIDYWTE